MNVNGNSVDYNMVVLGFGKSLEYYDNCKGFLRLLLPWYPVSDGREPCSQILEWSPYANQLYDMCLFIKGYKILFPAVYILPEEYLPNKSKHNKFKYGLQSNIDQLSFQGCMLFPYDINKFLVLYFFLDQNNKPVILDNNKYKVNKYYRDLIFKPTNASYTELQILKWGNFNFYQLLTDGNKNIQNKGIYLISLYDETNNDYIAELLNDGIVRRILRIKKYFLSQYDVNDQSPKKNFPTIINEQQSEKFYNELNEIIPLDKMNLFNKTRIIYNPNLYNYKGGSNKLKKYTVTINNKKYIVNSQNSKKAASWAYRKKFRNKYSLIYVNNEVYKGICYKNGRKLVKKITF